MKRLSVLAILLCSAAVAQPAPSVCKDGKCIQIASYNIEYLGGKRAPFDGVPRPDRTDEQLDQLAKRIADTLDLEIVVFEEINTKSEQWAKLKSKLAAHGYKFFEGTTSDRNQFVVLAWDADEVTLLDNSARELDVRNSFELDEGCKLLGLRKPIVARFKAGEFDFWVVGVHLKSQVGEKSCNDRARTEQCKDLVKKIDEFVAKSGERDVVIVGDFNARVGDASLKPLVDAGFTPQMKYLMPESAKGSFVKNRDLHDSTELIDQVMIRYNDTREVVKNSACVLKIDTVEERKKYVIEQSDHVPAWVSFRTDKDLDDAPAETSPKK
jgi:endonuclease/exonuclease/phosphatase family metal-dependent hydrolase